MEGKNPKNLDDPKHRNLEMQNMTNRDMFKYRKNRQESKVVKLWHEQFKKSIFHDDILLCYSANAGGKLELGILRNSVDAVEITADTLIGWLNSPVGRSFINQAFGTEIPLVDEYGDEAK